MLRVSIPLFCVIQSKLRLGQFIADFQASRKGQSKEVNRPLIRN
jgi:hypothetical protein